MAQGLLHIYYGDGAGKTTAAMGLAARALGRGGRVIVAQFLKDGTSGELAALGQLEGVTLCCETTLCGFWGSLNEAQRQEAAERCCAQAERAFARAAGADLLVLDELVDLWQLAPQQQERLLALLDSRPAGLEVVLTGHSLPEPLAQRADYITHMQKVRHPFDRGVAARRGVEF